MRPTCKSAASVGDPELTLDLAPDDAGMFFCGDLAEDGTVQGLLRRLAVGRRPELAFDDGFDELAGIHVSLGVVENDDCGIEQGEPFDRLVGFVRGIDDVFIFLVVTSGLEFLFRFVRIGCSAGWSFDGLLLRDEFLLDHDPACRDDELFVFGNAGHTESVFEDFDDFGRDDVPTDFDIDDGTDFDFADAH